MRSTRRLVATLAIVSACAPHGPPVLGAQQPVADEGSGRWARLSEPLAGGAVRFTLARPGYVALFAVVPGDRVQLLYPAAASQSATRFSPGTHTRAARRGALSTPRLVRLNGGPAPQPRYVFLIASTRPLRLDEALGWASSGLATPTSVRGELFDPRAFDVDRTFEALFDLVVPSTESADVDTDVLEEYPDVRFYRSGQTVALSAFRCYDGQVVYAPSGYDDRYSPRAWYGVDFDANRYVGADCYRGYYLNQHVGSGADTGSGAGSGAGSGVDGVPVGSIPGRPRQPSRPTAADASARDIRPSVPWPTEQLRPFEPGPGASPAAGFERLDPAPPGGTRRAPAPRPGRALRPSGEEPSRTP